MAISTRNLIEILISARDDASKQLDKVGQSAAALDKKLILVSASMAAAGAAIITAVSAAAIAGAKYADTIDGIAQRTQTSRETITALGVQLEKTGGSFQDSEAAVRQFDQAVVDALSGQKLAVAQFQRLGIGVDELVGPNGKIRRFDELLPRVAEGFKQLGDEALATDSAVALFGRGATAFIPVLTKGAQGFRDAKKEAAEFNAILGGSLQQQAVEFGGSLHDLEVSTVGLKNALAGALNPTLGETIRNLTEAAKAAGQFTQAHPQLVSNIVATTTVLTGLAATPAIIKLVGKGFKELAPAISIAASAAEIFGKKTGPLFQQARGANGRFGTLKATALGVASGFSVMAAAVGTADALISLQSARHAENARAAKQDEDSARSHANQIERETGTIEEQIQALEKLRTERGNIAARKVSAVGVFDAQLLLKMRNDAFDRAVAQFDQEMKAAREKLIKHAVAREGVVIAGIQIEPKIEFGEIPPVDTSKLQKQVADWYQAIVKPAVEQLGPTLEAAKLKPKIDIDTTPIDPRDFAAQIKKQQEALATAVNETTNARTAVKRAGSDPANLVKPTEDLNTALKAEAEIRQRIFDLQRQAESSTRDLTRAVQDNEQALTQLAIAGGKITLDEGIVSASKAVDKYKAELDNANKAVENATPGTVAYTRAVENQTQAIRNLQNMQQILATTVQASQAREQERIETANAMTEALKQLTRAREDLAITEGKGTAAQKQSAVDASELARLKRESDQAQVQIQAQSAASASGLGVFGPSPEQIASAANAMQIYSNALLQAQQQTEKLSVTTSALGALGSGLEGIFSAIASGAKNMAQQVANAMKSMIVSMIAAIAKALLLKVILGAITGGAGSVAPIGTIGLPIPGRQKGGEVVSGVRGRDTELVRVGRGELITSDDLTDRLSAFLTNQEKADKASSRFAKTASRSTGVNERIIERDSGGSSKALDKVAALIERQARRGEDGSQLNQPVIHIEDKSTHNTGVRFGTEIEDQQASRQLNERNARFLRGFVAQPSFTG